MDMDKRSMRPPVVLIAGSRRFASQVRRIYKMCNRAGLTAICGRASGHLSPTSEETTAEVLHRIDHAEILYIVAISGYVGHTVSAEIDYAHSHGKMILASEAIIDPNLNAKVTHVMPPEHLVEFLKETAYRTAAKQAA